MAATVSNSMPAELVREKTSAGPAATTAARTAATTLEAALQEEQALYEARLPRSQAQFEEALASMPGGNTRSVLYTAPFPVCMKEGRGNRLWDVDGHAYVDLVGELSAGLYGHRQPVLQETLAATFATVGVNLGATTAEEGRLAALLCARFPSVEQVRFCNSGTEANLYALSIARHVTGRSRVVCFAGGYHGGVLGFGSDGTPAPNVVDRADWVVGAYNDAAGARRLLASTPDVAAVLVEAVQGAGGCIPGTPAFLHAVQAAAAEAGAVFILDEVMTSRLHAGGLQSALGLRPDLTTLGKYLGGGLAFGAFGGRRDLLAAYDPRQPGSLPHSGTFNNNTLAMACGYAGLTRVYTPAAATALNALGDAFRARLQAAARGTMLVATGVGAVLTLHFVDDGRAPADAAALARHTQPRLKKLFWFWCLRHGYWVTERGMLSVILGTTAAELDAFVDVVAQFLGHYASLVRVGA